MLDIKEALRALAQRQNLTEDQSRALMQHLLENQYSPAQVAAYLMALSTKGETLEEIVGAARAVQDLTATQSVDLPHFARMARGSHAPQDLFNLSLAAAFAAAAAGSKITVHDGSPLVRNHDNAELLHAFGIKTYSDPQKVANSLTEIGVGFTVSDNQKPLLNFDPAAELGVTTLLNTLSLVATPFVVRRHLIGVRKPELCKAFAQLFASLGAEHVMVVHSADGLDAISLATKTQVAEWVGGELKEYEIAPDDFGIQSKSLMGLNQTATEDVHLLIKDALGNRRGHYAEKAADIISLNAGALIYVSGLTNNLKQGVNMAREVIANTRAGEKIRQAEAFAG